MNKSIIHFLIFCSLYVTALPDDAPIKERLTHVTVSKASFKNTNFRDALGFIMSAVFHEDPKRIGINLALFQNPNSSFIDNSINFDFNRHTALEALDEVCTQAKLKYHFNKNYIMVATTLPQRLIDKIPTSSEEHRIKKIIIPELHFRYVPLKDALTKLTEESILHDKTGTGLCKKLLLDAGLNESFEDDFSNFFDESKEERPRINLSLRNISCFDALNIMCEKADVNYSYEGKNLEIKPRPVN